MNNEELKKKIVEVLFPVIKSGNILCNEENACKRCWFPCEIERTAGRLADALIANKFGRIINFAEYVGSKIAGHSNYHGDSILCALYRAAEGKEIRTVKPLDITEYGYNVLVKERDEYKHRAEVLKLALSKSVLDENAIFDDDVCRYILSNTKLTEEYYIEQAEKELAEGKKDD